MKLLCPYLVQHLLHQIQAQLLYTDLDTADFTSFQNCSCYMDINDKSAFFSHEQLLLSFFWFKYESLAKIL